MADTQRPAAQRWGVVLAGGEGVRLRPLTRVIAGDERPKQFCRILGRESLLGQACRRMERSVPASRTLVVLTRCHEPFYMPLLDELRGARTVIQPAGRGTATAVLYALLRIEREAPDAAAVLLPCDHYVSDDALFMAHVDAAFEVVQARPELVVLLGVSPAGPETAYGWIEAATRVGVPAGAAPAVYRVRRFWEKPVRAVAESLLDRGCLWNSFVVVARVPTLLAAIRRALPALFESFTAVRPLLGEPAEALAVGGLYDALGSADFSAAVLQGHAAELAVLPVHGVAWSDWGDPRRVLSSLAELGQRPGWARAAQAVLG
jgi:mannose-1-phosphate guanylyltransferase